MSSATAHYKSTLGHFIALRGGEENDVTRITVTQVREENKEGKHFLPIFYQVTGTKWGNARRNELWLKEPRLHGFYRETTKNSRHAPARPGKLPFWQIPGTLSNGEEATARFNGWIVHYFFPYFGENITAYIRRFERRKPDSRFAKTISANRLFPSVRGECKRGFFAFCAGWRFS